MQRYTIMLAQQVKLQIDVKFELETIEAYHQHDAFTLVVHANAS